MNVKKVLIGIIIYVVWSVLIGFFVPEIESWASIMAALAAGIYVGYGSKAGEGFTDGLLTGLAGGILCGVLINYIPSLAGIPLKVSTSEILSPAMQFVQFNFPWILNLDLVVIGFTFGAVGGFIGSREKLKYVFIFATLFVLYIFYGAIDNVAWNWETPGWTWNMSVSHVLTNRIDLFIAVVFAAATTILAFILLS